VVYEAEQVSLGRRVALKALRRHVVGDHKALQRFRRERRNDMHCKTRRRKQSDQQPWRRANAICPGYFNRLARGARTV
jgi:hypothetical protein